VALGVFIVVAVASQAKLFVLELTRTLPIVILHNALGLVLGYIAVARGEACVADRRAVVIEGGMQNSGLALGIIAAQYGSDLAMVAVAGLVGHLAYHFGRCAGRDLAYERHEGERRCAASCSWASVSSS
jgi:BASS family bile acid:Na+ symporter